jgi:hypothetical protein
MKNLNKHLALLAVILSGLLLTACPSPTEEQDTGPTFVTQNETVSYTGPNSEVVMFDNTQHTNFSVSVDLGAQTKDVFFVVTNTNYNGDNEVYQISGSSIAAPADQSAFANYQQTPPSPPAVAPGVHPYNQLIALENAQPIDLISNQSRSFFPPPEPPLANTVGVTTRTFQTRDFEDQSIIISTPTTLRKSITVGTTTFLIWVEDESWHLGGSKSHTVTQEMIDILGEAFLTPGDNNDIYDLAALAVGDPWGPHSYSNIIPPSAADTINMVLFDIDNDDNDFEGGSAVIGGFFTNKDNLLNGINPGLSDSNEALVMYVDSVQLAWDNGVDNDAQPGDWEITDFWPNFILGTVAHEYQHMVHFYEKRIASNSNSSVWLNEMASMVLEDLLADKIMANGPRGMDYDDYTTGSPTINSGRLPGFNGFYDYSLFDWLSGNDVLISYANSYSLGAYLVRNYGGPGLLKDIVNSPLFDAEAIEAALANQGYADVSFKDILQRWIVAALVSDNPTMGQNLAYNNNNAAFSWTTSGATFQLGSIDLWHYDNPVTAQDGPYIFSPAQYYSFGAMERASSRIIGLGSGVTGTQNYKIKLEPGVRLAVVIK